MSLSITIPGWVVAAVILSVVWFLVARAVLRAIERRSRLSVKTKERLTVLAGPVIWIVIAAELARRWTR